jgi:hypothetical protein
MLPWWPSWISYEKFQLCKEPSNGHPYIVWVQLCLLRESYYLCSLNTVILGTEYMLVLIWGIGTLRYKKGAKRVIFQNFNIFIFKPILMHCFCKMIILMSHTHILVFYFKKGYKRDLMQDILHIWKVPYIYNIYLSSIFIHFIFLCIP